MHGMVIKKIEKQCSAAQISEILEEPLDIIQQNFTTLLDAPEISSNLLPAKREPVSVTRDK